MLEFHSTCLPRGRGGHRGRVSHLFNSMKGRRRLALVTWVLWAQYGGAEREGGVSALVTPVQRQDTQRSTKGRLG